jgi:hypothetical protein
MVIISIISKLSMLVLLMERIYQERCCGGFRWREMRMNFYGERFSISSDIMVIT